MKPTLVVREMLGYIINKLFYLIVLIRFELLFLSNKFYFRFLLYNEFYRSRVENGKCVQLSFHIPAFIYGLPWQIQAFRMFMY